VQVRKLWLLKPVKVGQIASQLFSETGNSALVYYDARLSKMFDSAVSHYKIPRKLGNDIDIIDSRGSEGEELSVYVIRRYSVAYKSVKRVLSVSMKNCCILQLIIGGKLV